jgi:hypothetical protein
MHPLWSSVWMRRKKLAWLRPSISGRGWGNLFGLDGVKLIFPSSFLTKPMCSWSGHKTPKMDGLRFLMAQIVGGHGSSSPEMIFTDNLITANLYPLRKSLPKLSLSASGTNGLLRFKPRSGWRSHCEKQSNRTCPVSCKRLSLTAWLSHCC